MAQTGDEDVQPTFGEPLRSLLSTALAMERQLAELLPELISQTSDPILRNELEKHLEETHEHARDVEEVFHTFGKEPTAAADPVLVGLHAAHQALMQNARGDRRVLVVVATAAAAEHTEIGRYEVLRALAESCGNPPAVKVIVRVLDQERQALKQVCESMHRLLAHAELVGGMVEAAG